MKLTFRLPFVGLLLAAALHCEAATLAEIYNLAIENDPQLGAAQAVFLSQNEVVAQNRAFLLPNVALRGQSSDDRRMVLGNPSQPTARYNDHGWQAVLNQPIFRLDSWYRFKQARDIQAEAVANFAGEQQALIVRVAESYFAILEQEAGLSASNAERDAVQRQRTGKMGPWSNACISVSRAVGALTYLNTSSTGNECPGLSAMLMPSSVAEA